MIRSGLQSAVFAPPPPPSVSPQPTVLVGVGQFGAAIVDVLRARQQSHMRFEVDFGNWFDRFVYDVPLSVEGPEGRDAVGIREAFLQGDQVGEAAHTLRKAFRDSRQHANQPWTGYVLPRLIVVGATWEPSGCALLWPAAALSRLVVGQATPYELLGLFVSAGYRADQSIQIEEDAHTFVTLREGDQLVTGQGTPNWYRRMAKLMGEPSTDTIDDALYDHIFLIDALKENNATSLAADSPTELHTFVAAVLEALLFTPTYELFDQSLLDDFPADERQVYAGAGASALAVPLRELEQVLRERTISHLIRERLLVPLRPEQRQDLQKSLADHTCEAVAIQELHAGVMVDNVGEQPNPLPRLIASLQERGVHVEGEHKDYWLRYHLQTISKPSGGWRIGRRVRSIFGHDALAKIGPIAGIVPDFGGLRITGPDPFSSDLSLRYLDVMNRLMAERNTIITVLNRFEDALIDHRASRTVESTFKGVYEEQLGKLLSSGDMGLMQAIEILERAGDRWGTAAEDLTGLADQTGDDPEIARLRDAVDGEQSQVFEEKRLKTPLRWKPRFSSLLLRGLALVTVLYQFYWTAVSQGAYPIPLEALGPLSFPAIMSQPWWEWLLFGLLTGAMLVVIAFLYGIPTLALNIRLRFHRRSMTRLARAELERQFIRYASDQAETMRASIDILLEAMAGRRDELAAIAEQYALNVGDDTPASSYLEYKIIKPSQMATPEQLIQISRQAAAGQRGQALGSWVASRPLSPVDLLSADQIIGALTTHVQPLTTSLAMQPVSDYLREDDHRPWFQHLWQSAAPWIKSSNGEAGDDAPTTCNILLLREGANSSFASVASQEAGRCHVAAWPDPYRILLLRLLGGVRSDRLARDMEWRQAFQHLPEERRLGMSLVPGLSEQFPCTLAKPEPSEPTAEVPFSVGQEALADILYGLEDAVQALLEDDQVTDAHQSGVDLALEPLRVYNQDNSMPDKQRLVDALKPLDESWEQWTPEVQMAMSSIEGRLDEFLISNGLEPVRPATGVVYDPRLHGAAVATEESDLPEGVVTRVLYRGYHDASTGTWLREPAVIVSSGRPMHRRRAKRGAA